MKLFFRTFVFPIKFYSEMILLPTREWSNIKIHFQSDKDAECLRYNDEFYIHDDDKIYFIRIRCIEIIDGNIVTVNPASCSLLISGNE